MIENIIKRVKNREFRYLFKRIFPSGNIIFYTSTQLIFRLSDFKKFDKMHGLIKRRCKHEMMIAEAEDVKAVQAYLPEQAAQIRKRLDTGIAHEVKVQVEAT